MPYKFRAKFYKISYDITAYYLLYNKYEHMAYSVFGSKHKRKSNQYVDIIYGKR